MKSFVFAFFIAAITCALLTPLARRFAFRVGAVSLPGGRHVHKRTIPRLGGIAIFFAFFAPLIGFFFIESSIGGIFRQNLKYAACLLVGGGTLCLVGALDDTRRVRALHKLLVQVAVALGAYACGFRIDLIALPLVGNVSMGIFSLPVTVLWIVGIVNAINLVDGLDGLAGGIVFFAGLTNFVVAYVSDSMMVALLMATLLGSVVGFLFYNFNPARIFMGDSGSYFLGFILATTSLLGSMQRTSTAVSLLVPILALGVPIFDTLFAMVRRILERRPIFSPDRGHVHHRLLDMGITHRRAVLILYGVCVVFTAAAIGVSLGKSWQGGLAMLGASVILVAFVRFAGYFEYLHGTRRQKARLRSRDAEMLRRLIPEVPALFAAAKNEEDLWKVVREMLERAELKVIEVIVPFDAKAAVMRFAMPDVQDATELVTARYPLGRDDVARASIKFAWASDVGDVSPQCEILLQVIADMLTLDLARFDSEFAPAVLERDAAKKKTASASVAALELPMN